MVEPPEIEESLTKENPGALAQVVDILLQDFEGSTSPRVKGEGTLGGKAGDEDDAACAAPATGALPRPTGAFPYNP